MLDEIKHTEQKASERIHQAEAEATDLIKTAHQESAHAISGIEESLRQKEDEAITVAEKSAHEEAKKIVATAEKEISGMSDKNTTKTRSLSQELFEEIMK